MTKNTGEKTKSFWFYISNDYRSGRDIETFMNPPKYEKQYDEDDEDDNNYTPEEACEIEFVLPKEGTRLYIVNEFPKNEPIWYKDINDDDIESLYLKIFSQIHDCMPFKVTGYNSAYKELGHYPDIPDDIKNLPKIIDKKLIKKISKCEDDGYYFLFVADSEGNEIMTHLLNPI